MSGQQNNQPQRGWNRRPNSPIYYQAPTPWKTTSPAPNSATATATAHNGISGRSTPMSPMFGGSGLRGSRTPQSNQPRPKWPGSPPPQMQTQPNPSRSRVTPSPINFINGPKPYRAQSQQRTFTPIHMHNPPSPVYGPPPEYFYSGPTGIPVEFTPRYEYVGVPLEPPQPQSYVIYDDEDQQGPTTAEIIANQSQDYIDEKLAEYQMTIAQLQGEFIFYFLLFFVL